MNRVVVKINGQEYTMVGVEPKEYLLKLANLVDEKLQAITHENPKLSTAQASVLTSLNVFDEYLKCKTELEKVSAKYDAPLQDLKNITEITEELKLSINQKDEEIKMLREQINNLVQENKLLYSQNEDISNQLLEKDSKIEEAQVIISDFQNRLYDMQIKLVEAEKNS